MDAIDISPLAGFLNTSVELKIHAAVDPPYKRNQYLPQFTA